MRSVTRRPFAVFAVGAGVAALLLCAPAASAEPRTPDDVLNVVDEVLGTSPKPGPTIVVPPSAPVPPPAR